MRIVIGAQEDLRAEFARLPAALLERARGFNERRRLGFLAGRTLLLAALKGFYGLSELPEIKRGARGKPEFSEAGLPAFSLTHSGALAAAAVGTAPQGLDLEQVKPRGRALWERVLNRQELDFLRARGDELTPFLLWTLREALLKTDGRGLGGLGALRVDPFSQTVQYAGPVRGRLISWSLRPGALMALSAFAGGAGEPELWRYAHGSLSALCLEERARYRVNP